MPLRVQRRLVPNLSAKARHVGIVFKLETGSTRVLLNFGYGNYFKLPRSKVFFKIIGHTHNVSIEPRSVCWILPILPKLRYNCL